MDVAFFSQIFWKYHISNVRPTPYVWKFFVRIWLIIYVILRKLPFFLLTLGQIEGF